jgi:hypothetical protein
MVDVWRTIVETNGDFSIIEALLGTVVTRDNLIEVMGR